MVGLAPIVPGLRLDTTDARLGESLTEGRYVIMQGYMITYTETDRADCTD